MMLIFKLVILKLFLILNFVFINVSFADNHNIYETLEIIKNDLKTLERAVYSGSIEVKASTNDSSVSILDQNSEDVLTRHLLKLRFRIIIVIYLQKKWQKKDPNILDNSGVFIILKLIYFNSN